MKKMILISVILTFLLSTNIFAQNDWSSWKQTDCLQGLEFRVKLGDYNSFAKKYKWHVEFRNLYKTKISFSFIGVAQEKRSEIRNSGNTKHRKTINANGGISGSWFLINSSSDIYVYVNKIRIKDKDVGPYDDCDK